MARRNEVIDFVMNNKKILLLAAILLVLLHKYIVIIALGILFTILGTITVRVTKFVPHISVETITGSAILFGFIWGWKVGLIFGLGAGLFAAVYNGFLKLTTIVNSMLMGLCGVIAALFFSMDMSFGWTFFWTFVIRANLGFVIFQFIKPDVFENIMHSYGDALFNILIVSQLMGVIYRLIVNF